MSAPTDILQARLRRDLTDAMRSQDGLRTATLRLALAAVREAEVAGKQARTLGDDAVLGVLRSEVKKRLEAADAFERGGRVDKAEVERAEAEVLSAYLPAALGEEEVEALVEKVLLDGGFSTTGDLGPAMRAVMAAVDGRADGKAVAALVRSRLR